MLFTKDLAHALSTQLGLPYIKVRNEILPATLNAIIKMAQEEGLTLTNFGVFNRWDRPARLGRNPKTGDPVPVPPSSTLRFRPSKALLKYPERDPDTGRMRSLIDEPDDAPEENSQ